jgi:hypothetical protein
MGHRVDLGSFLVLSSVVGRAFSSICHFLQAVGVTSAMGPQHASQSGSFMRSLPGGLCKSPEEHQPDYGLECVFELIDRRTVAASFLADHPPGLEVGDGAFYRSPNPAERGVEFRVTVTQVAAGDPLDGDDAYSINADIAEVSGGRDAFQEFFEAGRFEGMRVVTGTVHGQWPDRGDIPAECGRQIAFAGSGARQDHGVCGCRR